MMPIVIHKDTLKHCIAVAEKASEDASLNLKAVTLIRIQDGLFMSAMTGHSCVLYKVAEEVVEDIPECLVFDDLPQLKKLAAGSTKYTLCYNEGGWCLKNSKTSVMASEGNNLGHTIKNMVANTRAKIADIGLHPVEATKLPTIELALVTHPKDAGKPDIFQIGKDESNPYVLMSEFNFAVEYMAFCMPTRYAKQEWNQDILQAKVIRFFGKD